jgi:pheromone shutdown-related protein TraB
MGSATSNNVTVVTYQDKTIYLVGTAHVSQRSVEEVHRVIHEVQPNTVCVELDRARYETLTDIRRFRNLDIFEIIRNDKLTFTLGSLVLTSYQRRMGAKLGVVPGAELLAGVHAAREVGARVVLADRDVQITLKRSWARLSVSDRSQLMLAMVASLFASSTEISEEQIEALKNRDNIQETMAELAKHMPRLQVPLIDERDRYLMSTIREAEGPVIVGVVGAGHVGGMLEYVHADIDRQELCILPTEPRFARFKPWLLPGLFLGLVVWAAARGTVNVAHEMLLTWVLTVALTSATAAVALGSKLVTALSVAVLSPWTTLVPIVKTRTVAAWVEAYLRKPTEHEREKINDALLSFRDMRANPFIRILLVGVTVGLVSAVAAGAATAWSLWLLWR